MTVRLPLSKKRIAGALWNASFDAHDFVQSITLSRASFPGSLPTVHGSFASTREPVQRTIFVGADLRYFLEHAEALVCSIDVFLPQARVHFHIFDPPPDIQESVADLQSRVPRTVLTLSCEATPRARGEGFRRTYYGSMRFVRLYQFLEHVDDVVMLDIDSILRGPIEDLYRIVEGVDVGIYLRPDQSDRRRRIAAGIFYCRNSEAGLRFMKDVALKISWHLLGPFGCGRWYLDQRCLFDVYQRYLRRDSPLKVGFLSKRFADWEFADDSAIWAGKAERKHVDAKYRRWSDRITGRSGGRSMRLPSAKAEAEPTHLSASKTRRR